MYLNGKIIEDFRVIFLMKICMTIEPQMFYIV
jgi:hypothetical protein